MSREVTLFASAARTASENSELLRQVGNDSYRGIWLKLDVTAAAGTTPTLDVIVQRYDPASDTWVAIPGAVFTQKTGIVADELTIYPTMTAAANDIVKEHIGDVIRAVATIGGTSPSFTFSLGGQLLR